MEDSTTIASAKKSASKRNKRPPKGLIQRHSINRKTTYLTGVNIRMNKKGFKAISKMHRIKEKRMWIRLIRKIKNREIGERYRMIEL